MSLHDEAARVCERLAKEEAKKANQNRGKRKTWLIRRRAFLEAAAAIRGIEEPKHEEPPQPL